MFSEALPQQASSDWPGNKKRSFFFSDDAVFCLKRENKLQNAGISISEIGNLQTPKKVEKSQQCEKNNSHQHVLLKWSPSNVLFCVLHLWESRAAVATRHRAICEG